MKFALSFVPAVALVCAVACIPAAPVAAHCEVPCGIYDDAARFKSMQEDATTIQKAIEGIHTLAADPTPNNINQMGRWITTKEDHATKIQHVIAQYFMTQRLKPETKNYVEQLTKAHAVLVAAMKCKQAAEPATAKALSTAIHDFQHAYGDGP